MNWLLRISLGTTIGTLGIFSPPLHAQSLKASDWVCDRVLEDFSSHDEHGLPPEWSSHSSSDLKKARKEKIYQVMKEDSGNFLRAEAKKRSVTLHFPMKNLNLDDYPVLSWRWRARTLPEGAREDQSSKNDAAAALYVIWESSFVMRVKSIKFTWSTLLSKDTHVSKRMGHDHVHVLRDSTDFKGDWVEELVNVKELARKYYKKDVKNPVALALLTDSDQTKGIAAADYGKIVACREKTPSPAPAGKAD